MNNHTIEKTYHPKIAKEETKEHFPNSGMYNVMGKEMTHKQWVDDLFPTKELVTEDVVLRKP